MIDSHIRSAWLSLSASQAKLKLISRVIETKGGGETHRLAVWKETHRLAVWKENRKIALYNETSRFALWKETPGLAFWKVGRLDLPPVELHPVVVRLRCLLNPLRDLHVVQQPVDNSFNRLPCVRHWLLSKLLLDKFLLITVLNSIMSWEKFRVYLKFQTCRTEECSAAFLQIYESQSDQLFFVFVSIDWLPEKELFIGFNFVLPIFSIYG